MDASPRRALPPPSPSPLRVSQRQPTACKECSRRKVRCDKQIPCSRCVRLSKPCTREVVRVSKSLTVHRDELQFLRHLLDQLRFDDGLRVATDEVERRIRLLETEGVSAGPDGGATPTGSVQSEAPTFPLSAAESGEYETNSLLAPKTIYTAESQSQTQAQSTSLDPNADLTDVDHVQNGNASILTAVEFLAWGRHSEACYPHKTCSCYQHRRYSELTSINSDPTWIGRQAMSVQLDADLLLPEPVARKVLHFHLNHIHWHHNAFHAPTFMQKCEQFWQYGTVDHPLWMALYLSVCSVSLWTLLNNDHHRRALGVDFDETLVEKQFQSFVNILNDENFLEHLSLYSIQAIVISTRIAHNLGRSDLNATLVGAAVRIAHCLGLHKISELTPDIAVNEPPQNWYERIEVETGKRVWLQLVIQDHFQIPFTDTYIINPSQYTTALPRNCNDHDMIEREDKVATGSSYVRMLANSAALVPPLLDGLGPMKGRKPVGEIYEHILAFDQAMRSNVQRIPEFLLRESAPDGGADLLWLPLARRTLAISAAEKIIMIHRPVLFHSFQSPAFAKTRATCIAAATTILREHEYATAENSVSIWTHSAFCVTAAMVLGLELFHRTDHTDDTAHRYRQMIIRAAERLRRRRSDAIGKRGAILIDTILAAEEDLVVRLMRTARQGGSVESRQRSVINEMIGSHEIMAKFLSKTPQETSGLQLDPLTVIDPFQGAMDLESVQDFEAWFNEVFAPVYSPLL